MFALFALSGAQLVGQTDYGAGSRAAAWLMVPSAPRSAAMTAQAAVPQGLESLDGNVAGLAGLEGWGVAGAHNAWLQGSAVEGGELGWGNGHTGIAVGGHYLSFGAVDAFSVVNGQLVANGSLDPSAFDAELGLGMQLGHLFRAGLEAGVVQQQLAPSDTASTVRGSAGLLWGKATGLSLGLSLEDLGGQLDGASLPGQAKVGAAYGFGGPSNRLALAVDYDLGLGVSDGSANALSAGLEWFFKDTLAIRGGYQLAQRTNLGGTTGLSAGLGLRWDRWSFDYAFVGMGDLGSGNQLSLGVKL